MAEQLLAGLYFVLSLATFLLAIDEDFGKIDAQGQDLTPLPHFLVQASDPFRAVLIVASSYTQVSICLQGPIRWIVMAIAASTIDEWRKSFRTQLNENGQPLRRGPSVMAGRTPVAEPLHEMNRRFSIDSLENRFNEETTHVFRGFRWPGARYSSRPATHGGQVAGEGATDEEADDRCSICLERYERGVMVAVLPCRHRFHGHCIRPWFNRKFNCAYCRREFEWDLVLKGSRP